MRPRVLVAGVGNLFLGDDGFGVEVVRRLGHGPWGPEVSVVDYGIRGVHLAYDLLDPPELLVIADAVGRSRPPGTLFVIDPAVDPESLPAEADPHGMSLPAVFASVQRMGGTLPTLRIVGCEPLTVAEGMGLSAPVAGAIDGALRLIRELVESTLGRPGSQVGGPANGEGGRWSSGSW